MPQSSFSPGWKQSRTKIVEAGIMGGEEGKRGGEEEFDGKLVGGLDDAGARGRLPREAQPSAKATQPPAPRLQKKAKCYLPLSRVFSQPLQMNDWRRPQPETRAPGHRGRSGFQKPADARRLSRAASRPSGGLTPVHLSTGFSHRFAAHRSRIGPPSPAYGAQTGAESDESVESRDRERILSIVDLSA